MQRPGVGEGVSAEPLTGGGNMGGKRDGGTGTARQAADAMLLGAARGQCCVYGPSVRI